MLTSIDMEDYWGIGNRTTVGKSLAGIPHFTYEVLSSSLQGTKDTKPVE